MTHWREYHERTKHTRERLARSNHTLDWANMPDPFRHYEGVPLLDLPADPPAPDVPMLDVLRGASGSVAGTHLELLSSLFFYSASISASKRAPGGYRYALRVNPSSGNLHPTEFHLATPAGLFHYRCSSHMLDVRGAGRWSTGNARVLLTTVPWREAWKYGDRAYRYCVLDAGHAAESVTLAARALGLRTRRYWSFEEAWMQGGFSLPDDEWPLVLLTLDGLPPVDTPPQHEFFGGTPSRLSEHIVDHPLIDEIHALRSRPEPSRRQRGRGPIQIRALAQSPVPFAQAVRQRRSALNFTGKRSISFEQFSTLLDCSMRGITSVHLYVYVHLVDELPPGVYRYWHHSRTLEPVRPGDQRVIAAGLSLTQELAGTSCVTFSMVGELERGGYRIPHFEAGMIGQRLYLAAEAMGFNATGIGAFFDDEVHRYLGIEPDEGQVVYHFACGYAVHDPRLAG